MEDNFVPKAVSSDYASEIITFEITCKLWQYVYNSEQTLLLNTIVWVYTTNLQESGTNNTGFKLYKTVAESRKSFEVPSVINLVNFVK